MAATATRRTGYDVTQAHHHLANPDDYDGPHYTSRGPFGQLTMALDSLEIHFAECCTRTTPCNRAAFLLLATGQVEGAHGHAETTEAADDTPRPTGGDGTGRTRKNSTGPTPKQAEFLAKLTEEALELAASGTGDDATDESLTKLAGHLPTTATTPKQASTAIDIALEVLKEARATARKNRPATTEKTPKATPVEEGMYSKDGEIYRVVTSGSGRRYAKRLVWEDDDDKPAYVYDRGAITRLTPADRMSEEEAAQFGKDYGVCCVCARKLTNPDSIDRGIGPICADRV